MGQCRVKLASNPLFMGGVKEGEEETHADTLSFAVRHLGNYALHIRIAEGADYFAVGADTFGHFETAFARHQGFGMIGFEVVDLGTGLTADFEEILEACGGDESDLSSAPL